MIKDITCRFCRELFSFTVVGVDSCNGALLYEDVGGKRIRGRNCYLCYRKNLNKIRNHSSSLRYEKTKNGFLVRLYRNMKSRVSGIQYKKKHLYFSKSLLEKNVFYKWADQSPEFHRLFEAWEKDKFSRKLTPTVDRINSQLGYEISNMRWMTHSENSSLGARSRVRSKST